jgi:hypothetical protein
MTVKEIAIATSKPEQTVKNWVKKTSAKMDQVRSKMDQAFESRKPADYDLDETCAIIETGLGKNAANMYRMNAKSQNNASAITFTNQCDTDNLTAFAKIADAMSAIAFVFQNIGNRVNAIEQKIESTQALLPAPGIDTKTHINKLVKEYAFCFQIDYKEAWQHLYREFGYRTRTNPSISAKNRGMRIIDYIETEGQIETLLSIAIEVLK